MITRLRPDVAIVDFSLPGCNGAELTRDIGAAGLPTRVLIVSMYGEEANLRAALEAGAAGYILKDTSGEDFLRAVPSGRLVQAGNVEEMVEAYHEMNADQADRNILSEPQ